MASMSLQDIKAAIETELTVPVWPHVGRVLGLSRNSVYEAVQRGEIETIRVTASHVARVAA